MEWIGFLWYLSGISQAVKITLVILAVITGFVFVVFLVCNEEDLGIEEKIIVVYLKRSLCTMILLIIFSIIIPTREDFNIMFTIPAIVKTEGAEKIIDRTGKALGGIGDVLENLPMYIDKVLDAKGE